jgi:uncharacterized protein YdbL (DUF1318 family)
MRTRNHISKCLSIMALVLTCASFTFAAGEKERMLKRIPQIKALKDAGVIGEKANGLLGAVKDASADKALVAAENKDRTAVYVAIAKGQKVSTSKVAKRRALQIVGQAASGDWLQGADGKWYQKK